MKAKKQEKSFMKQKRIMGMLLVFTLVLVSAFVLLLAACLFHNTEKVSAASKLIILAIVIIFTFKTKYGDRTLVIYISRVGNTEFSPDVDAVSSASLQRERSWRIMKISY